ncbi:DUF748 domain-containing protein [Algoriphagus kandeliae]|uniref:DUF748 domain-containing protein n=1 Tax=Algoriphagus kandeliae TaxID=2562278 RepID=A0A4Y9QN24_9BACT|nr:DUF748 domain-containing protein [Algoriphagus kandeliae]TFV92356.1 DUF748 domain-containing protein [Algoriphagus kandeliae]
MKRILFGLGLFLVIFFGAGFYISSTISDRIQTEINKNPDRSYDLNFEDIDVSLLRQRVQLERITVIPLKPDEASSIQGSLEKILLNDFHVWDYFSSKELIIGEIILYNPVFQLTLKDRQSDGKKSSQAFQSFFGDIVRRGEIKNLHLINGKADLYDGEEEMRRIGGFTDLDIYATGIQTDRRILTHLVPFELEEIKTSLKNLELELGEDKMLRIGEMSFDLLGQSIQVENVSFKYSDDLIDVSKRVEHQEDILNFDLKSLSLHEIDASSDVYGQWSVIAKKLTLDSLVFVDLRNKNKPRPVESTKKLFVGLMGSIPFPVDLDTVLIKNSRLDYLEIGSGKEMPGLIRFDNLNARIEGFVTVDSLRKQREMRVQLQADFMGHTPVNATIHVPYDKEEFRLNLSLSPVDLNKLTEVTEPLAGVKINSGMLHKFELQMEATEYSAQNTLTFDYEDFQIEIGKKGESGNVNKFATLAGNMALRTNNLPDAKNYRIATYQSTRNVYRGPFNFIWETSKEGIMEIIPSGVTRIFLNENQGKKPKTKSKK